MTRLTLGVGAAIGCALAVTLALAGDLNPPPGAPVSTMKTLQEVEPRTAINATNTPGDANSVYKITQPGSYYLTGNITGEAGKGGIHIVASDVTLDLMGFNLLGVEGSVEGVSAPVVGLTNIAVVNGSVRDWGYSGVSLGAATNCRVVDVLTSGDPNDSGGINVGSGSTVSNCDVRGSGNGIFASPNCTIVNCTATGNGTGIAAQEGSTISNCAAGSNFTGILTYRGCTLSNCSAFNNAGEGLCTNDGCTLSNCVAYANTGNGIRTGYGCALSNCSAHNNQGDYGIYAFGNACTLTNCEAFLNYGSGIGLGSGGTLTDSNASWNTDDGIVCSDHCVVRGNACWNNGNFGGTGAGIHATDAGNRMEGNTCTGGDRGIDVDAAGNIIIRNTCAGNTTNYAIVANNYYGPIIDRAGVATAAVNGSAAASTLASTDANANFSY